MTLLSVENSVAQQDSGARWWLLLTLFLFTLGSHYFYSVGLYLFQIAGLVLSILLFRPSQLRLGELRLQLLIVFFVYAFGSGAMGALVSGSNLFLPSKLLLPVFFVMWLLFSGVVFGGRKERFHWALHKVIWIHIGFFIFQLFWFFLTSDLIDFLEPFTGEEQRALGGVYELTFLPEFIRATGLYNEPGTYSTWLMTLFLLFRSLTERLGIKDNFKFLEIFAIGSIFLSFSTFGFIFALMYVAVALFERKFSPSLVLAVFICVLPLVYLGYEVVDQKMALGTEESGVGFRLQALQLYFSDLTASRLLFGLGMFSDFFLRADAELVFQDVGMWFVIVSAVGVVGSLLLVIFLVLSVPRKAYSILLLMILMMSKGSMTSALLWVVLMYFAITGGSTVQVASEGTR